MEAQSRTLACTCLREGGKEDDVTMVAAHAMRRQEVWTVQGSSLHSLLFETESPCWAQPGLEFDIQAKFSVRVCVLVCADVCECK